MGGGCGFWGSPYYIQKDVYAIIKVYIECLGGFSAFTSEIKKRALKKGGGG
jgi:hypothetical protein